MSQLPGPVRDLAVTLAAEALGTLSAGEVPAALRPVARFAPARRGRLGGAAIATALEVDTPFRGRVLAAVSKRHPGLVKALDEGSVPGMADPVLVATVAYLLRAPGWEELVNGVAKEESRSRAEQEAQRETGEAARLRRDRDAARAEVRDVRERKRAELDRLKSENVRLRRALQHARQELAAAETSHVDALTRERDQAVANAADTAAELRRLRSRLTELEQAREAFRRDERTTRGLRDARLSLLIDTLVHAAGGLRRELALPTTGMRPGDVVATDRALIGVPRRSWTEEDPSALVELLALPRTHLVVDGYNVTKSAWPTSPLEPSRTRLVQALAALGARTGAEVTAVFDGAAVGTNAAVPGARGVRVLFSTPEETADDLIRALVRAEPEGRPIVVVSSDREVADGVRRPNVHPVSTPALVAILAA